MELVTIDSRYGKVVVPTNDKFVGRSLIEYGEFSEGEARLFKKLITPEMVVTDVGANFGTHTLLFSKLCRQVYAFEPQKCVFEALCETMKLNDVKNVMAINAPVGTGSKVKYQDLNTDLSVNNYGSFSFVGVKEGKSMQTVQLTAPCDFLKIDVEGMEIDVLRGAESMIKACMPILYVENDRRAKADMLIQYINYLGYDCYWDTPSLFNEDNFFGKKENIFPDTISINMLCVKKNTDMGNYQKAIVGDWDRLFLPAREKKRA
jgi:FkbM family methyltransferase